VALYEADVGEKEEVRGKMTTVTEILPLLISVSTIFIATLLSVILKIRENLDKEMRRDKENGKESM